MELHALNAERLSEIGNPTAIEVALIESNLAIAEQLRLANVIALLDNRSEAHKALFHQVPNPEYKPPADKSVPYWDSKFIYKLRPEIVEALGMEESDESD